MVRAFLSQPAMEGSMFDDRDPNRDLQRDPYINRYSEMSDGSGYAPLIALFAIALIVGGLFMFAPSSDQSKVAANSPTTQSAPAPPPATPAPPPPAPAQQ
jgi:hypothetical protein